VIQATSYIKGIVSVPVLIKPIPMDQLAKVSIFGHYLSSTFLAQPARIIVLSVTRLDAKLAMIAIS